MKRISQEDVFPRETGCDEPEPHPIPYWIDVAPAAEFPPGQSRLVEDGNAGIAVFNVDGIYHALSDTCTHEGFALLGSGLAPETLVQGAEIVCPRHGARFCLRTGAALNPPACLPLARYPVRVERGMVQILPHPLPEG